MGLGIGTPLLFAIIWAVFGSPAAPFPVKGFPRILLEIIIFGCATIALYSSGKVTLAFVYAITVIVNRILIALWDQ
jgi:hypothetical protein